MNRSTKVLTAVALTVGLIGSVAAYGKHRFGDPSKRAEYMVSTISEELELDTTQEQALNLLKDEMLTTSELIQEQMGPLKSDIESLFKSESFDQNRALELITSKTATINEAAPNIVAALGNFMDSLDADQKAEVLEHIESGRGERHRSHRHNHD